MAGGAAVAAPRAVAVKAGPGLRAAAAVFTAAGRAPGSSKDRKGPIRVSPPENLFCWLFFWGTLRQHSHENPLATRSGVPLKGPSLILKVYFQHERGAVWFEARRPRETAASLTLPVLALSTSCTTRGSALEHHTPMRLASHSLLHTAFWLLALMQWHLTHIWNVDEPAGVWQWQSGRLLTH